MKRQLNKKALWVILGIALIIFLAWFTGRFFIKYPFWQATEGTTFLIEVEDGLFIICAAVFGICVLIMLGFGIYYSFNWIFPKEKLK